MKHFAMICLLCFSSTIFIGQPDDGQKSKPKLRKLNNYKQWANEEESQTQNHDVEIIKPWEKPKLKKRPGKRRTGKQVKARESNGERYRELRKKKKLRRDE